MPLNQKPGLGRGVLYLLDAHRAQMLCHLIPEEKTIGAINKRVLINKMLRNIIQGIRVKQVAGWC